jgi:hypothetical protein
VHVTTRIEDRKDEDLLFDKGGNSFPSFLVLDAEGEVLARLGPPYSVKAFADGIRRVREYLALAAAAKPDDRAAQIDLAILRCDLGQIPYDDLEMALEPLGERTEAQEKARKAQKANAAVEEMRELLARSKDAATRPMVAEEFLALHEEGSWPSSRESAKLFWVVLAEHALANEDAELLRRCVDGIRTSHEGEPDGEALVAKWQAKLDGPGKGDE